jgi:hypothetical protein
MRIYTITAATPLTLPVVEMYLQYTSPLEMLERSPTCSRNPRLGRRKRSPRHDPLSRWLETSLRQNLGIVYGGHAAAVFLRFIVAGLRVRDLGRDSTESHRWIGTDKDSDVP